jgi:hypothetical protein
MKAKRKVLEVCLSIYNIAYTLGTQEEYKNTALKAETSRLRISPQTVLYCAGRGFAMGLSPIQASLQK